MNTEPEAGEAVEPTLDPSLPVIDLESRYEIIDEHARGGMAKVFLVRDKLIGREIALKQLAPLGGLKVGTTPSGSKSNTTRINRFVQEAKITAQLQHPATVPVYEMGQTPEGVPFYTMKFVRGRTLREAVSNAQSLTARLALLPHFIDLCQALAYSHNYYVVHRDLKPDNIMVGEFGETVVLDWGIAKVLDGERESTSDSTLRKLVVPEMKADETSAEDILGTPHYMAPEQADPGLGEVDARTDIYALGAILYHILTGGTPYVAYRIEDLLIQVAEGKPRPIRTIEREAPGELVAICERAMQRLPHNRYATAKELAEEVTRYITGGRVQAYRYRPSEIMARFMHQNRTLVRMASTAAGILILFAIWSYVQVSAQRTNAEFARDEAESQRQLATELGEQSERNFAAARQAVEDFLTEVSENDLMETPGAGPVRRVLLERALDYYQSFIGEYQDNEAFQSELADAYLKVGRINDEMGDQHAALPAIESAITILDKLNAENPDEPEYQYRLAAAARDAAWANYLTGNAGDGFAIGQRSLALRQDLVTRYPDNPRYQAMLAAGLYEIADVVEISGDDATAVSLIEQALGIYKSLADADPSIPNRTEVAKTYRRLGDFYLRVNRVEDALAACNQSVAIHRELLTEAPGERERQFEMAFALSSLGGVEAVSSSPKAETTLTEAIDLFGDLREHYPSVEKYQYEQSSAYRNLSDIPAEHGDFEQAAAHLGQSTGILRELLAANPGNQAYRLQFAIQLTRRMDALRRDGRYVEAELDGLEAIGFARGFAEQNPEATDGRIRMIEAMMNLALVYLDSGKTGSFILMHEQMLALRGVDAASLDLPSAYRVQADWLITTPIPRYQDPRRAAEFAEIAMDLEGESAESLELLGRAHFGAGNTNDAVEAIKSALEYANADQVEHLEALLSEFQGMPSR